jgi:hypothetical protein
MFNLGLAYARAGELAKAEQCLAESVALGGARFPRARGPLEVVKAARARDKKSGGKSAPVALEGEAEWETLY